MNESPPPLPSLPVLSPTLLTSFNTLSGGGQRIFKAMYGAVWHYLWPISRFDEVAQSYTIPDALGSLKPSVTISQWFLLSRLWCGLKAVRMRYSGTTLPMAGDIVLI